MSLYAVLSDFESHCFSVFCTARVTTCINLNIDMHRITMFRSTDLIYNGGLIDILKYHCVTIAYSIQYSNMLYSFVVLEQYSIPYSLDV
jgi:hypothetical protein